MGLVGNDPETTDKEPQRFANAKLMAHAPDLASAYLASQKAINLLPHIRYLAGCACGNGDFSDGPPPTADEWGKVLLAVEDAITEYEETTE